MKTVQIEVTLSTGVVLFDVVIGDLNKLKPAHPDCKYNDEGRIKNSLDSLVQTVDEAVSDLVFELFR